MMIRLTIFIDCFHTSVVLFTKNLTGSENSNFTSLPIFKANLWQIMNLTFNFLKVEAYLGSLLIALHFILHVSLK